MEILLQGLLSKLVCGLDTSVKTLLFCKTYSVVTVTHPDFVFNGRSVRQHRISTTIPCPLSDSVWQRDFKDCHLLNYVHSSPFKSTPSL